MRYFHIYILLSFLCIGNVTFAADASKWATTDVTELLPGMSVVSQETFDTGVGCICIADGGCDAPNTRKYRCNIEGGISGFQSVVGAIIRYAVYIGLLLWVLALVALGIAWSVGSAVGSGAENTKKKIQWWLINALFWLIVLFFFSAILRILAPWIYQ